MRGGFGGCSVPGGAAGGSWDQLETLHVSQGACPRGGRGHSGWQLVPVVVGSPRASGFGGTDAPVLFGLQRGAGNLLGGLRVPDEETAQGFRWQTVS